MYRYFAIVGGAYTMGAIAAAAVLAVLVRHRPRHSVDLSGAVGCSGFRELVSVLVETPGGQLRSKK